jgi:putative tributyrin esterase
MVSPEALRYALIISPSINLTMKSNQLFQKIVLVLCLVLAGSELSAQSIARVDSFYMPSLGRTKKVSILMPQKYDPRIHYPVLYLLHGYMGDHDNWRTATKIGDYMRDIPMIIVMPDAENSWYVNSATAPNDRFEDYMTRDLPNYIQKAYSIDTAKVGIAGLSMGGYGALMLALRHPALYRFAGSLSGAITFPRGMTDTVRLPERSLIPSLRRAFGEKPGASRNAYDLFLLYRQVPKGSMPYLYMTMGTHDAYRSFLPAHRALTDLLRGAGVTYEYHETPGGHGWQYWDSEIQPLLKKMREVLKF